MSDTKPVDGAIARLIPSRTFSLMPSSLGEAKEIASMIAASDFAPKDYKGKPNNVIIALQMGADLGLKPMQALQNIAVINGRPSIYGDAALALCMPALERFHESFEGAEGTDAFTAVCIARRKGWPDETVRKFSVADAKAAGLWGKSGPWQTYPKRMLQWRARGFTLRDVAADLLLGLVLAEEAADYPSDQPPDDPNVITMEVVNLLDRVPEGLRDNVEKAFAMLNLAPGLRLAKINEFLGGDGVDAEDGATKLLEWCRSEYAARQGRPREKKGDGNGKSGHPPVAKHDGAQPSGVDVGAADPPALPDGAVPRAGADESDRKPQTALGSAFLSPQETAGRQKPVSQDLF